MNNHWMLSKLPDDPLILLALIYMRDKIFHNESRWALGASPNDLQGSRWSIIGAIDHACYELGRLELASSVITALKTNELIAEKFASITDFEYDDRTDFSAVMALINSTIQTKSDQLSLST